ncbi:hypothetical protein NBRC116592_26500 [Colwellia sp. KU-HH00111]|uniref:FG-GAP repeat domain-containing protein n=1 Tax=Colwellia sp. KU-HH00111 TaxID=3127652 RepID=UPI00310B7619
MKTSNTLPLLLLSVLITACGGGGGSDKTTTPPPPPANVAPTANAGTDQSVNGEIVVTLSGSGTDPDGTIASYSWAQSSGASVTLSNASTSTATFTAPSLVEEATLTFELTVTDDDGAVGNDSVTVVISPAPIAPVINIATQKSVDSESRVVLVAHASDEDGDIVSYHWQQTPEKTVVLNELSNGNVEFIAPSNAQLLEFILTVTDVQGLSTNKTVSINVLDSTSSLATLTLDEAAIPDIIGPNEGNLLAWTFNDFDGDGSQDFMFAGYNWTDAGPTLQEAPIHVFTNSTDGQFTLNTSTIFSGTLPGMVNARFAESPDFNGDGKPDLIMIGHGFDAEPFPGEPDILMLSTQGGTLEDASDNLGLSEANFSHALGVADIDNDGDIDIIISTLGSQLIPENKFHVLINDGLGMFTRHDDWIPEIIRSEVNGGGFFTSLILVDLDNDNDQDLVFSAGISGQESWVLWNPGNGNFSTLAPTQLSSSDKYKVIPSMTSMDVDGDGYQDLLLSSTRDIPNFYDGWQLRVLINDQKGQFNEMTNEFASLAMTENGWVRDAKVIDVDSDGDQDIVLTDAHDFIASQDKRPFALLNNGSGVFTPIFSDLLPKPCAIIPFDVDKDEDVDFICFLADMIGQPTQIQDFAIFRNMSN